ncbi:MAG: Gfo/Idh/MocA family oxidoreductase [Rhodospirillales bacterium]|nr:Gfo/Idh/MocA family oxidoreductase [Rhodospirillales bacterium]
MRVAVVGLGIQGGKRQRTAGPDLVATIDPVAEGASHRRLDELADGDFDAVLLSVPDPAKPAYLFDLLGRGKHVLVEKPLILGAGEFDRIEALCRESGAVLQVAYNHRFEPHFIRMREVIASGQLGSIYAVRLFYGNGTARDVRQSPWRDEGLGVIADLGSHLLDTAWDWFGGLPQSLRPVRGLCCENRAPDHAVLAGGESPFLLFEVSYLSWRNHFAADIVGERGSAHIEGLCKWGPATFTLRRRVYPSGRPLEETESLAQPDPTWDAEYAHFKHLCAAGVCPSLERDRRIAALFATFDQGPPA